VCVCVCVCVCVYTGLSLTEQSALFKALCGQDKDSSRLSFSALFQGLIDTEKIASEDLPDMLRCRPAVQLFAAGHVLKAIGGSGGHKF
jgi:hypothetical protein